MPEYRVEEYFSNVGDRNTVRMRIVDALSLEKPGAGKDDLASRYTYFVEELNGKKIYLRRPANLHNGFDFLVCIDEVNFNPHGRFRNYPSHDDIIGDLMQKKINNPRDYKTLFSCIKDIYECKGDVDTKRLSRLSFGSGLDADLLVAIIKWLFIEQDIRYWNYSGRNMLWKGIEKI